MENRQSTFEDVQRQVDTLHRMMYRIALREAKNAPKNGNQSLVHPEEIKDMIEKTFEEMELDLKNDSKLQRWYLRIIQGFGLKPRILNKKKRLRSVKKAA